MGSKVTISAPTIQKLLVFWNSGMASTKHTWCAHWNMRARETWVSPYRDGHAPHLSSLVPHEVRCMVLVPEGRVTPLITTSTNL